MASHNPTDEIIELLLQDPRIDLNNKKISLDALEAPLIKNEYKKEECPFCSCYLTTDHCKILLANPLVDVNCKIKNYTIKDDFKNNTSYQYDEEKADFIENTLYQYDEKTALQNFILKSSDLEYIKLLLSSEKVDVNVISCSLKIQITNDCIETFKDENTALKFIVEKYENDRFNQYFSLLLQHPLIDINKLFLRNNIEEYLSKNETFNSIIKLNVLHFAILNENLEAVKILSENSKVDINILKVEEISTSLNEKEEKMIKKDSPLHVAVKNTSHHQMEIIEFLMKNQFIDLKIEDSDGKTPYYCTENSLIKKLLSTK